MKCQDNSGIWTGPDPFFSLPNDKEKKSGLATWDYMFTIFATYWLHNGE